LWVAKDPDFSSIGEASFARLKNAINGEQAYNAYVGRALVTFVVRHVCVSCCSEASIVNLDFLDGRVYPIIYTSIHWITKQTE